MLSMVMLVGLFGLSFWREFWYEDLSGSLLMISLPRRLILDAGLHGANVFLGMGSDGVLH